MNILAIDTSTEACSAALLRCDGQVFSEYQLTPRQHTRYLPKMMDSVLQSAGLSRHSLTHCAFANGPGAFTGIRIAAATIQGVAMGLGLPVVQVSTLATLAQTCFDQYEVDDVLVALDARMNEIYWGRYSCDENRLAILNGKEILSGHDAINLDSPPVCGVGHGWSVLPENSFDSKRVEIHEALLPKASALLKLAQKAIEDGHFVQAEQTSINYLRNQVAEKSRN